MPYLLQKKHFYSLKCLAIFESFLKVTENCILNCKFHSQRSVPTSETTTYWHYGLFSMVKTVHQTKNVKNNAF